MPLFWFMISANRIRRIKEKKNCFDVWLGPNPRTQQTTCIPMIGCISTELHGIWMFEIPPLLLKKWATIGSLSQNLFNQLHAKGEWLIILESLKKKKRKKKVNSQWPQPSTKQKWYSYELKRIYIYQWCPFGALASNFSGWLAHLGNTCLLSSSLPTLMRLLPWGDLGFYLYL